jgi:hypothetical protein
MMRVYMRRFMWPVLLVLLTLPAVWPLATSPFIRSDDILVHLFRLHGLDDAIHQGVFYPRLFPDFAFGYGHAVLTYYGPLSYYVAELARVLGADYTDAIKWAFALGFLGSACTAYWFARRFVAPAPALLGAGVYVYFPYHLVETYQRGALAEHMAWVLMPLVLWGITPRFALPTSAAERVQEPRLAPSLVSALSIAALVVTHSLVALMFMPFAVAYGWLVNGALPLRRRVAHLALVLGVGLGLSAFYWLPVAAQARWVQLSATSEGEGFIQYMTPTFNFVQTALLFDYKRGPGNPDHPLGGVDLVLLLAAAAAAAYGWLRRERWRLPLSLFILLSIIAMSLTVDAALPVWRALHPLLAFLQFPWRFMTVAGLGIAMASIFVFRNHALPAFAMLPVLVITSMAGLPIYTVPHVDSDVQSMLKTEFRARHIGSTYTEEYMPWWVTMDPPAIPRAGSTAKTAAVLPAAQFQLLDSSYTYRRYAITAESTLTLRMHQFYFPPWRVTLDGRPLATYPSTDLGLLSVDVPPTPGGTLEIDYASTDLEQLAIVLSLVAAALVVYLGRRRGLLGAAAAVLLVGATWGAGQLRTMPPIQSVQAKVGDVAELLAARSGSVVARPGDPIQFTLTWLALRETDEDLQVFVHVVDPASGRLLAQSDGNPVWGYTPMSQWRSGELIDDTRTLQIPADAVPGTYAIVAGLYRLNPLQNLPAIQTQQAVPNGQIPVGTLQVSGR